MLHVFAKTLEQTFMHTNPMTPAFPNPSPPVGGEDPQRYVMFVYLNVPPQGSGVNVGNNVLLGYAGVVHEEFVPQNAATRVVTFKRHDVVEMPGLPIGNSGLEHTVLFVRPKVALMT